MARKAREVHVQKPLFITRVITHRPYFVLAFVILLVGASLGLSGLRPLLIDTGFYGAFSISGDITSMREDALSAAEKALQEPDDEELQPQQTKSGGGISIAYEAPDGNLFSEKHIKRMKAIEDDLRSVSGFKEFCMVDGDGECLPFRSVLNYFYPSKKNISVGAGMTMEMEIPDGKGSLASNITAVVELLGEKIDDENVRYFLDKDFLATQRTCRFTRTVFGLGGPLKGFKNTADQRYEQRKLMEKFTVDELAPVLERARDEYKQESGLLSCYWAGTGLSAKHIMDLMFHDVPFLSISIVFVFSFIVFHTRSLFLSCLGVLHILFAFPLTYFTMTYIFGYVYLGMMDLLSFFIIIGIGADDIFVVLDAFKQSAAHTGHSLLARVDWSYRRAAKAMLVTSATTAGAFFANAFSPVPLIKEFGLFSASVVIWNYIMVITWFPAIIVIWEKRRARLEKAGITPFWTRCFRRCCSRWPCFQRRTHPTEEALSNVPEVPNLVLKKVGVELAKEERGESSESSGGSANVGQQTKKNSTGMVVIPLSGMGVNAAPESLDLAQSMGSTHIMVESLEDASAPIASARSLSYSSVGSVNSIEANPRLYRPLERFFYFRFAPEVYRLRYLIAFFFLAVLATSAAYAARLKPSTEDTSFLPSDHGFVKLGDIFEQQFGNEGQALVVSLIWGLRPGVDKSQVNVYDLSDIGLPLWDDDFDPGASSSQNALLKTCELAENDVSQWVAPPFRCLMTDFRDWVVKGNGSFPVPEKDFDALIRSFVSGNSNYSSALGWSSANVLKFLRFEFNATISRKSSWVDRVPHFDHWESFMSKRNEDSPKGVAEMFHTSNRWVDMATDRVIVMAGFIGVAASIGVALVLLIASTGNAITGLIATLGICGVVLTVGGCMVGLEWEIGVSESMCMTVLVGMSVDYSVHLATAYTDAKKEKTRYDRMRRALMDLGISITSAAITTLGCSLVMLATYIRFIYQFGIFLTLTISISIIFALGPFAAAMMIVGATPPHERGSFGNLGRFCPGNGGNGTPVSTPRRRERQKSTEGSMNA